MERRYENALNDLLESVAYNGHASISKWRITRWYGQENFTVNIRRDLRDRWKKLIIEELSWTKPTILRIADVSYTGVSGDIVLINNSTFFPDDE